MTPPAPAIPAVVATTVASGKDDTTSKLLLGVLVLVLVVLVVMLFLVTQTLRKIAIANGIEVETSKPKRKPLWVVYINNSFLVFSTVIFLLFSSAYFAYGYLMQVGIDQGYMPVQPIHYSHKIHSGDNEIECKYCHSSARVSKHSGIPSLNVCMNCHMNIAEYNGEEDLEKGYTKEFYTNEIKKLYKAVGWDEENQRYTGETQPVKLSLIHISEPTRP